MASTEFTCEYCGGTFPKAWTDEEAAAEAAESWGYTSGEDAAIICDDCFNALNAALHPHPEGTIPMRRIFYLSRNHWRRVVRHAVVRKLRGR